MDARLFTTRMATNLEVIEFAVRNVSPAQARWKPLPDKWSILEVINHLHDEEREDFRTRLDLLLHDPGRPWPGIDPQAWATDRKYQDRDLEESVTRFANERRRSIQWLQELESPAWENEYEHPLLGKIRAGDLLTSWLAHDYLHLRQLAKLHLDFVLAESRPYTMHYAGNW